MCQLLRLCLLLGPASALAQTASPVITAADMPTPGDTLRLSTAAALLPATAPSLAQRGPNQTWNYAGLVATVQRLARYVPVSSAVGPLYQFTFNSLLSGDNRATVAAPQTLPLAAAALPVVVADPYQFYNVSAADFRSVGYGATAGGVAAPVTYASKAKQDVIFRFPLSYASLPDSSSSFFSFNAAGSGYVSQQRKRQNTPDAWGALTTPFGTFQTVRVVTRLDDHDSLAVTSPPTNQGVRLPRIRLYQWLASGQHAPLLTIATTEVAGREAVTAVEYRDVYRRLTALATRDVATDAGLSTYPNPSATGSALALVVPAGSGPFALTATDLVGRQLFSQHFAGAPGRLVLDAALFGEFRGVALLTVTTARGTATRRVVRE